MYSCQKDDKTAPVITLSGSSGYSLIIGDPFSDPGATAMDTKDGDLTSFIEVSGGVNTLQSGVYTITYTVADF